MRVVQEVLRLYSFGAIGMVIIGLICMVLYSVLIIRSVLQTERFRGLWEGHREGSGMVDRDSFLPSLHLLSRRAYLGYYNLIFLCVHRAITSTVQHHDYLLGGIGDEALEESHVLHRGIWGLGGGVGYRCIISVLRRLSR